MGRKDSQRFSIRKYSFGAASVLTDTAADPVTTVDESEKQVVFVKEEGNTTVTTSFVTTDSLEDARTSAVKGGVEVEETALQHIHL